MSARIGSYTTARVTGGRVERVERHARRLRRDALRLGLPAPDPRAVESLLRAAARDAFGDGDGIVRVEWSAEPGQPPELLPTTRDLGPDPDRFRARSSTVVHPGAETRHNTKFVEIEAIVAARREAESWGVEEVLLFDDQGRLVEGSGSNIVVVPADGAPRTPALELGGVEGLGLQILRERRPEISFAEITREDLGAAREILATNGVRGVVAIVELDGKPVGRGEPGEVATRWRAIFGRD